MIQKTATSRSEHSFTVTYEQEGQRLDLFLSRVIPDLSRSHFKKLITERMVLVNGSSAKPSYETRAGDLIHAVIPEPEADTALQPHPMQLDLLLEDEDLLIVNKPPGLVVHPGAGHEEGTLVHGLLAHSPRLALQGSPLRPGIVHRLDKDTSGALVIARSERAYLHLVRQFKEKGVKKEYLALVYGSLPAREGEIVTLLGRHPTDRKKIAVLQGKGRDALSRWRVEKAWGEATLLRVVIETGRTHQIRVHLSHIGHPVVGDETYGGGKRRAKNIKSAPVRDLLLGADRQMLHAKHLEFTHPATGGIISVTAPLPEDFRRLIEGLDRLAK
ncbi:MAG: RluA family pseudouridine synthase [Syntrophobacteraceae bacterium]